MLSRRLVRPGTTALLAMCFAVWSSACGGDSTTQVSTIAGNYSATVFQVTPTGLPTIDVLAQGGTLTLSIAADNSTTGNISLPASVLGTAFSENLSGTAVQSGNTVHFQQSIDTFVRDLTFTIVGTSLQATNQVAGGASFTITLTRQ
ncbi:MAG: hypothetical protein JF589_12610 [Gemmatimonadetes bacterium]|jgi:hypothetical protein|nr:hypothetical protein [Gemmatimonadota bacterium]